MGWLGMSSRRKIFCTFPQQLIKEPLLYNLGKNFQVIPNIRGASVTDDIALIALELEGELSEIDKAVSFLKEKGVKVESIEGNEKKIG